MKKLILLAVIVLCSSGAFAACSPGANGTWTSASWSGCAGGGSSGPGATDAVTIGNFAITCSTGTCDFLTLTMTTAGGSLTVASGATLTNHCTAAPCVTLTGSTLEIQSGGTANLGSNTATSFTHDIALNAAGQFLEDNGATLNINGSINWVTSAASVSKLSLSGHTVCTPNGTAVNQGVSTTLTSSLFDGPQLSMVGTSWSSPAVFETVGGQSSGGNCRFFVNGGNNPEITLNYVIFNNTGDNTNNGFSFTSPGNGTTSNHDYSVTNILWLHSGTFAITTNSGLINSASWTMSNFDIRNSAAHQKQALLLSSLNGSTPSSNRIITGVTCDDEISANFTQPTILGSYFQFGKSTLYPSSDSTDAPGMYSYGCEFSNTGLNGIERNMWTVLQYTGTPASAIWGASLSSNNIWENSMAYLHGCNPHTYTNATTGNSSTANVMEYSATDGDYFEPCDSGEFCKANGTWSCLNNLIINGNQNIQNNPSGSMTISIDNMTIYNGNSISSGENAGNGTELQEAYDNIDDHPGSAKTATACSSYESFMSRVTEYISQTNFNEDNNMYYGLPNTGDVGARTCTTGATNTYLPFVAEFGGWTYSGVPSTCGPTTFCSVRANGSNAPFYNLAATTISGSPTTLTYSTGGFTTGSSPQNLVAVGDPVYNINRNQMGFVASITNDTTIVLDKNYSTWANGDSFTIGKQIWADNSQPGSATNRGLHDIHAPAEFVNPGVGTCDWYSANVSSLTCPTQINGTNAATNNATIGHAVISINGWDYGSGTSLTGTNCTSSCPQRVTPFAHNLTEVLKYLGQAYRPMNAQAKASGHNHGDLGMNWYLNYTPAFLGAQ